MKFNHQYISQSLSSGNHLPADLNRFYLSQGFKKSKVSSNDCGPACLAMMFNFLKESAGLKTRRLTKKDVISRIPLIGRVPGWVPEAGGATAPWGLTAAFNRLAQEYQLPWRAQRRRGVDLKQLQKFNHNGGFVTFLRFWEKGGAHWSNIMGLTAGQTQFVLLDPNPFLSHLKLSERIQFADTSMILPDWQRQPWWAALLGMRNEIILYKKISGRDDFDP